MIKYFKILILLFSMLVGGCVALSESIQEAVMHQQLHRDSRDFDYDSDKDHYHEHRSHYLKRGTHYGDPGTDLRHDGRSP